MLAWLRSLFATPRPAPPARVARAAVEPPSAPLAPESEPAPALPAPSGMALDHEPAHGRLLKEREQKLLARVGLRVERRQLELPQLPSTSLGAIDLCGRSHVEISDIVALIE